MKTVQLTLDESLVVELDRAAKELGITRSDFIRDALRTALENRRQKRLEERHREGYLKHPVEPGEFDDWDVREETT